jgi:hypothetical protein
VKISTSTRVVPAAASLCTTRQRLREGLAPWPPSGRAANRPPRTPGCGTRPMGTFMSSWGHMEGGRGTGGPLG